MFFWLLGSHGVCFPWLVLGFVSSNQRFSARMRCARRRHFSRIYSLSSSVTLDCQGLRLFYPSTTVDLCVYPENVSRWYTDTVEFPFLFRHWFACLETAVIRIFLYHVYKIQHRWWEGASRCASYILSGKTSPYGKDRRRSSLENVYLWGVDIARWFRKRLTWVGNDGPRVDWLCHRSARILWERATGVACLENVSSACGTSEYSELRVVIVATKISHVSNFRGFLASFIFYFSLSLPTGLLYLIHSALLFSFCSPLGIAFWQVENTNST